MLLGGLVLLPLLTRGPAAWSLAAGLGAAWLIWTSAEAVASAYTTSTWRARRVICLVALYFGKYALIAAAVWGLVQSGRLDPVLFTIGFMLPLAVALGKVAGRLALPADLDPVPVYARSRKVADVE